jgi:hypothetical protein
MVLCVIVVFEAFWKNGMLNLDEWKWYFQLIQYKTAG